MKKGLKIFLIINLFAITAIKAQELRGIAYYKVIIKTEIDMDSTKMKDPEYIRMSEMLSKPFIDEFELKFKSNESVFNILPKLKKPDPAKNKGMSISMTLMSEDEVIYKNLTEERFVNNKEIFGKKFLIKDSLQNRNWNLEKESKMIGDYTCFKATYEKEVELHEDEDDFSKTSKKPQLVTAWYSPQIPVKNGPEMYGGLPGLILELKDDNVRFLCTKIVLNPTNPIEIKEPTKGKVVAREEFNAIMKKKFKEMTESFKNKKSSRN